MFTKFLNNIQKYLFFWITGAVILGLAQVKFLGGYSFTPLICLLAAIVMIYPSLVPLEFGRLKEALKKRKIIIISLFLNFILSPALAVLIGNFLLKDEPVLWLGLILISLLPGGGMVTTWALKSKADMPATIGIIFFNLLAAVLIAPFALSFALNNLNGSILGKSGGDNGVCAISQATSGTFSCGLEGGVISPEKIIAPIIFIIIFPLMLAYITQIFLKRKGSDYFEKNKAVFGKFSNFGLVLILLILMGLKNNAVLFTDFSLVLISLKALAVFYLFNLSIFLFLYKKFFRNSEGRALLWGSYLKYITLALGLAISLIYGNSDLSGMVVIIVLSYFIQIPTSFWLAKYFKNN